MKKILLIIFLLIFCIPNNIFGSSFLKTNKREAGVETIEDSIDYVLGDIKMKVKINSVKFREDDENYIFIIDHDLTSENMYKNYIYVGINPCTGLSSFTSMTNFDIEARWGSKIRTNSSVWVKDVKVYRGASIVARDYEGSVITFDNEDTEEIKYCNDTFYLSDMFGYPICTKKNLDKSYHKLSINKNFTYEFKEGKSGSISYKYNDFFMNLKYEIKINKNDFMDYRYICTYIPEVFKNINDGFNFNERFIVYNMCSESIDLLPYVEEHSHDFKIKDIYKDYHELYCEGCEWTKKINHEYVDTYDSIENNLCVCGKHRYVNVHIENNIDNIIYDGILEPFDDFPKYEIIKIGQHLKKLEVRTKEYNKDIETNVGDDSESDDYELEKIQTYEYENELVLPEKVPNFSSSYHLYYDINRYNIVFNKENNYNIKIDNDIFMNNMVYEIDESKKLNKNKYIVEGYDFLGWCDDINVLSDENTNEFDKVKYIDEQELINLTYDNDVIINLYPVYKIIKFTVTYKNSVNKNVLKIITCDVNTDEAFPRYNEFNISLKDFLFTSYKINNKSVNDRTKGLIKYIKSDGKGNGGNIDVIANFSSKSASNDYVDGPKVDDSKEPGNSGNNDGNNDDKRGTDESNINETTETTETTETSESYAESNTNEDEEKDDKDKNIIDEEDIDGGKKDNDIDTDLDDAENDKNVNDNSINDENNDIINGFIKKIIGVISDIVDNIIKEIKKNIKTIIKSLGDIFNNIKRTISKFLDDMNLSHIKDVLKNIIGVLRDFINTFKEAIKDIWNNLLKIFSNINSFLLDLYDSILNIFKNIDYSAMVIISIIFATSISLYYLVLFILFIVNRRRHKINNNN